MIVREFITKLAFDADGRAVAKFDRAVRGLVTGLTAAVAAAGAMSAAAFTLANDTARYGDELAKTADRLGINTDALEQLRFAAERSGVAQRTLELALQRMTRRLSEAADGSGEAKNAIAELGLDAEELAKMTPEDALNTLSDALAGVENQSDKVRLAFKFFDSEGVALLNLLGEGSEEVNALREEFERLGGGLTEDQARGAEAFRDSLTGLQTVMQTLRLQIGAKLMPVLRPMIEQFTEFLVQNREIISARIGQAFEFIVEAMGNLREVAGRVVSAFRPLVDAFNDLSPEGKVGAAGAILALLSALRRLRGFFLFSGLILALEDIGAWMRDQPSLIGKILGPYEEFAEKVNNLVEALGGFEVAAGALTAIAFAPWLFRVARGLKSLATGIAALSVAGVATGMGVLSTLSALLRSGSLPSLLLAPNALGDGTMPEDEGERQRMLDAIPGPGENVGPGSPGFGGPDDPLLNKSEFNLNFEQNIAVPPGSTAEQISFIRRETERMMAREVDRAAKALEA